VFVMVQAIVMWRVGGIIVILLGGCIGCLFAQNEPLSGCISLPEFDPLLVMNAGSKVTFKCDRATPMDLIRATGRQTRIPIGIVLGEDLEALSKPVYSYDLEEVDARDALLKAIEGTGYSLQNQNQVMVLIAGDVTQRQEEALTHLYSNFSSSNQTMVEIGANLTGWMWAEVDGAKGFGGSIGGSTNDERFTLKPIPSASTEEIANRIVSLGSKGMWILRADPFHASGGSNDEVEVEPYQHYSNRAYVEH
jgi:hypothetical protein